MMSGFFVFSLWVMVFVGPVFADNLLTNESHDDLLFEDEFDFEIGESSDDSFDKNASWWRDGIKTTLTYSQTQVKGGIDTQRSSIRIEYEKAIYDGWYVRLDTITRFFGNDDKLAEAYGRQYSENKWQSAWLQYSRGPCVTTVGRQALIWGAVDGVFAVDIITPFDYTEQLFTDYSAIRLGQDMAVSECFFDGVHTQVFYTPEARMDLFQHHRQQSAVQLTPSSNVIKIDADADSEWGGRVTFVLEGFDITLMYARLFENTPVVVTTPSSVKFDVAEFDFYGASSSLAVGRLLFSMDFGYRSDQLVSFSDKNGARQDFAVGFEYTTASNHHLTAGVWFTEYLNDDFPVGSSQFSTLGWRKTALNDDLTMSMLVNHSSNPKLISFTLLTEYQWDDYWQFSAAIGLADNTNDEFNPLIEANESLSLSVKVEF